jgi:hypothetical protein
MMTCTGLASGGSRKPCHLMQPGRIRGLVRRAGRAVGRGCKHVRQADRLVRQVGAAQCPVWPVDVVVIGVLAQDQLQMPFPVISVRSRHSRRALPIQRSAIAFARGACTGVLMIRTPMAVNTASKGSELGIAVTDHELEGGGLIAEIHQQIAACWATHAPVGWAVMPARCTRRVWC